ncbi:MAG TPA: hypothetical protein VFR87_17055 [Nocardioidaceae bacterium]|nr:hypothetical protein [Nocardioidaceae bacterium]
MKRTLAWAVALSTVLSLTTTAPAEAFKPYTHNASAQPALADATDDGMVTIRGREYEVRTEVWQALDAWPSYYQAGVIGPDGFPDLTFGQSTIHPDQTGKWLEYLLTEAWAAQTDPAYDDAERGQILAFTYGFLTHAAGDMWAHTFVNDFAHGVFPGVGEIVNDVDKAEIALRHTIVEGYIGDATLGYDGNPDRTTLADGDVSNDSTPGIAFDAPTGWIYDKLVNPYTSLPVGSCDGGDDDGDEVVDDGCPGKPYTAGEDPEPVRGPLIDYFLDLQSDLQLQEAVLEADGEFTDCLHADWDCEKQVENVTVDTVRGFRTGSYERWVCIGATIGCAADPGDGVDDATFSEFAEDYLEAWIDDIEVGLTKWGEVGLASTRALFDPQTLRNVQNDECKHSAEDTQARADCEDAVGATDVLFHELDPFINDHLLSMAGAPDALGGIREALQSFSGLLDDIVGPAANPLRVASAAVKEEMKKLLLKQIKESYGVDVELLSSFMKHPTYWLDVEQVTVDLGPLGDAQVDLFSPEEHERLDALLELPADHHVNAEIKVPTADGSPATVTSSALSDTALFQDLEIFENATTTAKLLLLDAGELNRVAGDELVAQGIIKAASSVSTYEDPGNRPANVMVDALEGSPWLTTIDGDHVWRQDGLPRFVPGQDTDEAHGGSGEFPLWESCLLRPSFRGLYDDWETDPTWWPELANHEIDHPDFPALGDTTSSDPSDDQAPTSTTSVGGGPVYDAPGGTRYVGPGSSVTVGAGDAVFTDAHVEVESRMYATGTWPAGWAATDNGTTIPLDGPDGPYRVDTRAGDPCHPVGGGGTSLDFVLDTTAPQADVTSPAPEGVEHDTDDRFALTWTTDDGEHGSGVASSSATFDGATATQGQEIDTFQLAPGVHTIEVTATDNLGNTDTVTRTFRVRATSASLLANIERAWAEGLITDKGGFNGLRAKLEAAVASHETGMHETEVNQLVAALNQVNAKLDVGIQPAFGARLVAYLEDLIADH